MLPMVLFLLSSENKNSLKEGYMEMANFISLRLTKSVLGRSISHYLPGYSILLKLVNLSQND